MNSYLLVLLHSGIQLLGEVIRHIGHARLFLIATAQAALVLTCLLIVLLFGIFAVSLAHLLIFKGILCQISKSQHILLLAHLL